MLGQIERFTAATGGATRVLLVPSTRDVLALPVVPQPPLVGAAAGVTSTPAGCLPLANPSTLALNEVVLGATSADWLMACTREETAKAAAGEERLPALAAHLPAQRSYLPLFPPPLDCPVDCARGATALAMPATPDLLVLPSDLAPFAKLCPVLTPGHGGAAAPADGAAAGEPGAAVAAQASSSFVCVNPGRLTKGTSGEPQGVGAECATAALLSIARQLPLSIARVLSLSPASHSRLLTSCLRRPPSVLQAAPLPTCTSCRCPRRWRWRAARRRPPTRQCPTSWSAAAGWISSAFEHDCVEA